MNWGRNPNGGNGMSWIVLGGAAALAVAVGIFVLIFYSIGKGGDE